MKYDFPNAKLTSVSRMLRRNMTKQERKLWYDFLSNHSFKFRRQKVIGKYIVDFYCAEKKLAIEIDGSQHYSDGGKEYDEQRTEFLKEFGITVLRYTNLDIDTNFRGVCEDINNKLSE